MIELFQWPVAHRLCRNATRSRTIPKTAEGGDGGKSPAADAGLSVATLAIAWSLAHDFVGSTIIGATSAAQLADPLAATDVKLSEDVLAACNEVAKEIRYPMG